MDEFTQSAQPAGYYDYWGKTAAEGQGDDRWHCLVYHSLDVAAVGAVMLKAEPGLLRIFSSTAGMS